MDSKGAVYAAQNPSALARIETDGTNSVLVGGGNSSVITSPTSVHIAKGETSLCVTAHVGEVLEVSL